MKPLDLHLSPLRQLQVFVAVARFGTTQAAGDAIALSQSATSAALNQLQRLLAVRVFDRIGKRLILNDNGIALLPRAQALLDAAAEIERLAHAAHPAALRIGASTTIGIGHRLLELPADSPALASAAPPTPSIRIGNTEAICAAVADFALDVGLIEGPANHPHLHARAWMHDELILIAPPDFPGPCTSIAQLNAARWLLREAGSGTRAITDHWLLPHLVQYQRRIELGSSEAIAGAVAAGLGIACLSRWVVKDALAQGKLRQLSTPLPPMSRRYYLLTHRHKQPTRALERFLALAREWAGQEHGRCQSRQRIPLR